MLVSDTMTERVTIDRELAQLGTLGEQTLNLLGIGMVVRDDHPYRKSVE